MAAAKRLKALTKTLKTALAASIGQKSPTRGLSFYSSNFLLFVSKRSMMPRARTRLNNLFI